MPQTRVGISGWTYGPWRGTYYPPGLVHRRELEYASRRFNSIEINGTFYWRGGADPVAWPGAGIGFGSSSGCGG